MNWGGGYVSDMAYQASYFAQQSPVHLKLACLLHGVAAPSLAPGFTFCDLGSGRCLTAAVLAASNPQGTFYAVDFLPAHISEGSELAEQAALTNLHVLENSFEELVNDQVTLPQMDFVTLYGIHSWVNAENRAHVMRFLDRHVKPGGVVYINYNAAVGWDEAQELHELIHAISSHCVGTRDQNCDHVRHVIDQLRGSGSVYFTQRQSTAFRDILNALHGDANAYMAHEYMNQEWRLHHHDAVAKDFAGIGFTYACDAERPQIDPSHHFSPAQQALLEDTPADMREVAKDLILNTSFRQDVYVRSGPSSAAADQTMAAHEVGIALTSPDASPRRTRHLSGQVVEPAALDHLIWRRLQTHPMSLAQLRMFSEAHGENARYADTLVSQWLASGNVLACRCDAQSDPRPALRLNTVIARAALHRVHYNALASPVLGGGMMTSTVGNFLYDTLKRLGDHTPRARLTEEVSACFAFANLPPLSAAVLDEKMEKGIEGLLPLWRQFQIF